MEVPGALDKVPESESPSSSDPVVIVYVNVGSLVPYCLVWAAGVTVMGFVVIVRSAPTNVMS